MVERTNKKTTFIIAPRVFTITASYKIILDIGEM